MERNSNLDQQTIQRENVFIQEESNDDDDDQTVEEEEQQTKKKIVYYGKKTKPLNDGEITIEEVTENPTKIGVQYEPLDESKRQPRQEEALKELNSINERISSLVQIRQMGLSTPDNTKQLKQLMCDRKTAAFKLRRLQIRQRASNKYRVKQRKIVKTILTDFSFNLLFVN